MIKISSLSSNKKVELNIQNIDKSCAKGIRAAMYEIGKDLRKSAQKAILKKPKHGRFYLLNKNGRLVRHRASAPGEAPANFTGSLKRSVDYKLSGSSRLEFGVVRQALFVSPGSNARGVEYGKRLELGIGVEARPFLLPAIEKNNRNIQNRLETNMRKNIEEGKR